MNTLSAAEGHTRSTGIRLGVLALVALTSGCVMEFEPDVGEVRAGLCRPEDSDPATDVSYMEDLKPLFERDMGPGCGCHISGEGRAIGIEISGLNLTDHASLMRGGDNSREMIVVPGDPCASILLQKISAAPPFGARMPPSGPPFWSAAERKLLSDWIAEGARDN